MNETLSQILDSKSTTQPTHISETDISQGDTEGIGTDEREPSTPTPVIDDGMRIATFLDGHMQGRQLAITSDQDQLKFNKLEKPFLESAPTLKVVDYRKVEEIPNTREYVFKTVEGILNDAPTD